MSKTIGIFARLTHFLPPSVLLNIYNSLIHPYLSYGLVVWDQTSKTNLDKILLLQKRALRLIYFSNNSEHAIPLFLRSNIPPIDMLYYKSVALLMHDINHNLAPQNLKNFFTRLASIHSCNTRAAAAGKFNVIHSRTKQQNQRVSMGLTVNRQKALKLTVNRQKRNIFTVNRQMSEPKLAVKLLRYP